MRMNWARSFAKDDWASATRAAGAESATVLAPTAMTAFDRFAWAWATAVSKRAVSICSSGSPVRTR